MNTIIEKIRAEVNRLKKEGDIALQDAVETNDIESGFVCGGIISTCEKLLAKLDTLQEQPVKDNALFDSCLAKVNPETRDEVRMKIDKMIEQPVCDGFDGEFSKFSNDVDAEHPFPICVDEFKDFARYFYELGRQSKEEDVIIQKARTEKQRVLVTETDGNANVFWDARSLDDVKALLLCGLDFIKKQSKEQPVSEGLEEEIDKRWKEWISEDKEQVEGVLPKSEFAFYARHFAQWGAEHATHAETPKDLEEAAKNYAEDNTWVNEFTNDGEVPEWYKHTAEVFKAGASWQKEQMMKDAVEGIVTTRSMAGNIVTAHIDHQFKDGQKVKLIIVKED